MKNKLSLNDLKVNSFVTLESQQQRGGLRQPITQNFDECGSVPIEFCGTNAQCTFYCTYSC